MSQLGCAEEDTEVDSQLGYPPVYVKLCRQSLHAAGLPMPFTEGPPQRFLPYSPHSQDFVHLKDWDSLFPVVAEKERDSSSTRKFAEQLWQQLDHLGNAGFDPSKFRVDPYGNVVYWNADPSSPLAWDIDHWFPYPRGGKSKLPNLRIVQWQAYLRKRNRLEFLVPWWDLQHGCTINQFLSAFAAKNAEFRGEDESVAREHVGECRPWPQPFREKKALCGIAAAALESVPKDSVEAEGRVAGPSKDLTNSGGPSLRHWSVEEEEAVKKGVSKFGPGSWREIKEHDSVLSNRSTGQIKEKFRSMRGASRNNGASSTGTGRSDLSGRQTAATTALQKELRVKIMREEERREREEELTQLEETVVKLKLENERERMKALDLESLLKKRKHGVEKQRKWAESQTSYRLCLERVLRDTMHQTMSYKEHVRLTQEACNALIARLDNQKTTCEAMENDLLQRHSQREGLEFAAAGGSKKDRTTLMHKNLVTQGRDIVDVSSCVSLRAMEEDDDEEEKIVMTGTVLTDSDTEDEGEDEVQALQRKNHLAAARKSLVRHAIKVAMQVEDTKEAVDFSPWPVPVEARPPCPMSTSEYMTGSRLRIRESETTESASESDFADDEMSPALRLSQDGACKDERKLASELSPFHDGQTSAIRDFGSRNSRPGQSVLRMVDYAFDHGRSPVPEPTLDTPIPSAGESRSDSKREVQKDVIMVQTESSKAHETIDTAALYKQEYLDELLQQIRFQIPTTEVKGDSMADGPPCISQGHLDKLLEQVLMSHLDSIRRNETRQHQSSDTDDDEMRQVGKSNLDKWLQALLIKDVESAGSSPGRDTSLQTNSPALSQISVAAMRESLKFARHQDFITRDGDSAEKPKTLWGALLRKLTMKHQAEHENMLFESNASYDVDDHVDAHYVPVSNHETDITDAMNSLLKTSSINEAAEKGSNGTLAEGRHSPGEAGAMPGWPGGIQRGGIAPSCWHNDNGTTPESNSVTKDSPAVWKTERRVEDGVPVHALDYAYTSERRHLPRPLSDVDETSETESTDNPTRSSSFPLPDSKDANRPRKSVSIKVAGFVGWKKSSKKLDTKSQNEPAQPSQIG